MRVLCGILALLLALFALVQHDDPDPLFWGAAYAAGAAWCAIAALWPTLLRTGAARAFLVVSLAVAVLGVVVHFPEAERWWSIDVWWPEQSGEAAREGMGLMVVAAAMAFAGLVGLRRA